MCRTIGYSAYSRRWWGSGPDPSGGRPPICGSRPRPTRRCARWCCPSSGSSTGTSTGSRSSCCAPTGTAPRSARRCSSRSTWSAGSASACCCGPSVAGGTAAGPSWSGGRSSWPRPSAYRLPEMSCGQSPRWLRPSDVTRKSPAMSRRAVIHAGFHKTGTTSIQAALYAGREALARHGYAYPDTPERRQHTTSHFVAINGLFFRRGRAVTADFLAGIRSSRTSTILSAENLFGLPRRALGEPLADHWSRKAGILGGFRDGLGMQEMLVVIFLRDPADYLVSLFRQYLKSPMPKAATLDGCFAEFATWTTTSSSDWGS